MIRTVGKRFFVDIRADILKTLIDCLQNRFSVDQELIAIVQSFIQFSKEFDIRQIHNIFGADLPFVTQNLEFMELVHLKLCNGLNSTDEIKQLILHNDSSKYNCVLTILCRIKACTPQSVDTERSIKANNLFKTANLETENKYMYVYFNMPPLEKWDPRETIVVWINDMTRRNHIDLLQKNTAKKRPYFKGIFFEADSHSTDED